MIILPSSISCQISNSMRAGAMWHRSESAFSSLLRVHQRYPQMPFRGRCPVVPSTLEKARCSKRNPQAITDDIKVLKAVDTHDL
jgi:hypothetical protein